MPRSPGPLCRSALFGLLLSLGLAHAQSDAGSGEAAAATTLYFVHVDHLNTPREIYNQNQQLVWRRPLGEPFGDSPAEEDPSGLGPFGFPFAESGYREDRDIGRRYAMFRDCYDPTLGRFCQSDPIGLWGGINTYAYVGGSPLSSIDPNGLFPITTVQAYCMRFPDECLEMVGDIVESAIATVQQCLPDMPRASDPTIATGVALVAAIASSIKLAKGIPQGVVPLLGRNPKMSKNRTMTDLPVDLSSAQSTAKSIFRNQTKGQAITERDLPGGGIRRTATNGVQIRTYPDGSARLDLPGRGPRPKGETLHLPPSQ